MKGNSGGIAGGANLGSGVAASWPQVHPTSTFLLHSLPQHRQNASLTADSECPNPPPSIELIYDCLRCHASSFKTGCLELPRTVIVALQSTIRRAIQLIRVPVRRPNMLT